MNSSAKPRIPKTKSPEVSRRSDSHRGRYEIVQEGLGRKRRIHQSISLGRVLRGKDQNRDWSNGTSCAHEDGEKRQLRILRRGQFERGLLCALLLALDESRVLVNPRGPSEQFSPSKSELRGPKAPYRKGGKGGAHSSSPKRILESQESREPTTDENISRTSQINQFAFRNRWYVESIAVPSNQKGT